MNPAALSVKRSNMRKIVDYIICHKEVSRGMLAADLGLSTATVTNIITELIERQLVFESRQKHSSVGRKTTLLRFNADLCNVMTCEISNTHEIKLAVCNFDGLMLSSRTEACDMVIADTRSETSLLKDLIRICSEFLESQGEEIRQKICALGLCLGGMVNSNQLIDAPIMNWSHLNLVVPLRAALHLPVFAEGITRIKALYEFRFINPSERNILYLNLSTGIGMVNFFNGKMVMGKNGIAGEVGHISLNVDGPRCYCGNSGCFEYYCGLPQILKQVPALLRTIDPNDVFYDLVVNQQHELTAELLFKAHAAGSLAVHELLSRVSRYLGTGIAALQNIYDPDRIILSGYLDQSDLFVIENALIEAKSRTVNHFSRNINISRAHLKSDQMVLAISAFVLTQYLSQNL